MRTGADVLFGPVVKSVREARLILHFKVCFQVLQVSEQAVGELSCIVLNVKWNKTGGYCWFGISSDHLESDSIKRSTTLNDWGSLYLWIKPLRAQAATCLQRIHFAVIKANGSVALSVSGLVSSLKHTLIKASCMRRHPVILMEHSEAIPWKGIQSRLQRVGVMGDLLLVVY